MATLHEPYSVYLCAVTDNQSRRDFFAHQESINIFINYFSVKYVMVMYMDTHSVYLLAATDSRSRRDFSAHQEVYLCAVTDNQSRRDFFAHQESVNIFIKYFSVKYVMVMYMDTHSVYLLAATDSRSRRDFSAD
ncbi:hypothetical protein J6590_021059 [Homalodisca vitripennis]|nr:hypothetical protein J6590_021059 [Homalodisca vitripennis]